MMKKSILFPFLAALLITVAFQPAASQTKERRDVSGFDGINFGISGNLFVKTGAAFDVSIEGNPSYINDIKTVVKNGKLHIYIDKIVFLKNEKADIYVTLPKLSSLSISGSGKAVVENALKSESLDFSVSGSGRLEAGDVTTASLECSISGSGDIVFTGGSVDRASLSISGSGGFAAENTAIKVFETGISGSGSCRCNVTESLTARISGSGNVVYSGNPRLDVRSSGSGHVRSK